ncbi:hypothetical protein [Microvirga sp. 17 mud 1-3]|uniref:hypothetical protein n=1 Tax=Microvirga sp. 17 mud 1-3 TaxID=2082949 RepID=UPI0013A55B58|nr:hypothetical protein [Microvirga sp. 17 mud 1-3]
MKNQDHNTTARQEFIRNIPRETELQQRIEQRKAEMGEKYICHPANHVKRLDVPLPR